MSKPKKLTEGHSSGPQGYWDSISDAKKETEIERLQAEIERLQAKVERLTKRGFQDLNWQNDELRDENERLREFIEFTSKNLPSCVTITKRANGLYDCNIYDCNIKKDAEIERLQAENERLRKLLTVWMDSSIKADEARSRIASEKTTLQATLAQTVDQLIDNQKANERLRELVRFAYREGFAKADSSYRAIFAHSSTHCWEKNEWEKSETKQRLEKEVSNE